MSDAREFDETVREALAACAAEPIHIPGAIQAHGVLLALDAEGRVEQVSSNSARFLGREPADVIGRGVAELLGAEVEATLRQLAKDAPLLEQTLLPLPAERASRSALVHRADGALVLELVETEVAGPSAASYAGMLAGLSGRSDEGGLTGIAAQMLRRETGYDRVMVYRFTEAGHGVVVAEDRSPDLDPYLGLHFPDSDIPAQARALYLRNRVRVLADVEYRPVPLVPPLGPRSGRPLDMSLCALRAVSPVHVQYMKNMGACASLVVSVIIDGALWGLVACHHGSPKVPSPEMQRYADCLVTLLAGKLRSLEAQSRIAARDQADALGHQINFEVAARQDWRAAVLGSTGPILEILGAEGLVLAEGDELFCHGAAPPPAAVRDVLAWLLAQPRAVVVEDALGTRVPTLAPHAACASGLIALHLAPEPPTYLLGFRPEWTQQLRWAGDPRKQVGRDEGGQAILSPRASFAVFCETVRGRAQALPAGTPAAAEQLRRHLIDAALRASMTRVIRLEETLRRDAEERRRAQAEAEAANRAKSEFLANMSHEIRTPMTAILGFADLLQDLGLPTEGQAYVQTIRRNGEHLLTLLNDILDLSKIEAGQMSAESIAFSPVQVLEEAVALLQTRAEARGLRLATQYEGRLPLLIRSDPTRLRQILVNLIGNAIKFTERGEVTVRTRFYATAQDGRLCFSVRDQGIGMTEEQIGRLFRPFTQADGSTTRRFGGSGLGLTISRSLTQLLGGDIAVESRAGQGSTFHFSIATGPMEGVPLIAGDEAPAAATPTPSEELPRLAGRVLLAEDGRDNQLLIGLMLRRAGAEVTVADNGKLAVEAALAALGAGRPFGLILMDMHMPELDGYEATGSLRAEGYAGPIVALTASAMADDRERCLGAGCDDFLTKPVNQRLLLQTARRYLAGGPAAPPGTPSSTAG